MTADLIATLASRLYAAHDTRMSFEHCVGEAMKLHAEATRQVTAKRNADRERVERANEIRNTNKRPTAELAHVQALYDTITPSEGRNGGAL